MKSSEKGFTLLELCVCFILFSIFLECIWGFFTHIYMNYYTFNRQVNLDNEANNVEAFIRDNIRAAYELKISVEGGIIEAEHTNAIDGKAFQND